LRVAETLRGEIDSDRGVALVVHSGAGTLVPAMIRAVDAPVRAVVFVDAVLPRPGRAWFETAPLALADRIRRLAVAGRLPSWDQWFPPESIAAHLPEQNLRNRFVSELPRLPLAYFEERAEEIEGWDSVPCAYVQLSSVYDKEAQKAEARGWPAVREELDHLAM